MYFFVLRIGSRLSPLASTAGYASCWIDAPVIGLALEKAKSLVESQGWEAKELVESCTIERDDYRDNHDSLQYYEQAIVDGEVVVLYLAKEAEGNSSDKGVVANPESS